MLRLRSSAATGTRSMARRRRRRIAFLRSSRCEPRSEVSFASSTRPSAICTAASCIRISGESGASSRACRSVSSASSKRPASR